MPSPNGAGVDGGASKWNLARQVLHGRNVWGDVKVGTSRCGVERVRLTVYEPGSSEAQRRNARLWEAWRKGGFLLWGVAVVLMATYTSPALAVGASTSLFAVGWLLVFRSTRNRCAVLRLRAWQGGQAPSKDQAARYLRAVSAAVGLQAADAAMRAGEITAAQRESSWLTVWEWLASSEEQPQRWHRAR